MRALPALLLAALALVGAGCGSDNATVDTNPGPTLTDTPNDGTELVPDAEPGADGGQPDPTATSENENSTDVGG